MEVVVSKHVKHQNNAEHPVYWCLDIHVRHWNDVEHPLN
jgi:hypothetical protein